MIRYAADAPLDAVVPLVREVTGDTETPVSAFLKLRRGGTAFLLESGEQDGRFGRYSFVGSNPDTILRAGLDRGTLTTESGVTAYRGTPLEALRKLAGPAPLLRLPDLPRFPGGLVGAFGYDLVRSLEQLPQTLPDDSGFPAALFARFHTILAFDHIRQRLLVVSLLPPAATVQERRASVRLAEGRTESLLDGLRRGSAAVQPVTEKPTRPPHASVHPDDARFLSNVARAVEQIHAGEAMQVVLSRRLDVPYQGDAFDLYRSLRVVSRSPYMFYLEFPDAALAGCSPEMLVRIEDGIVHVSPIAGTRRRGHDEAADVANESELLADEKERAEHTMLVDLARNDVGRVSATGTVSVDKLMQVERFSHVMHLVSAVSGKLEHGYDALDAFAACYPAGTVTGAPKIRAMQLIEELETMRRGAYAGAVACISPGLAALDACITIRTMVIRRGRVSVQVGAGVVADSTPEGELAETNAKAAAMLEALA